MAKVGQKTISGAFSLIAFLPSLIKLAELFHGSGNGAQKKAAVVDAATQLLAGAGAAAAANNPAYKDVIGGLVDSTVAQLNASGTMPTP